MTAVDTTAVDTDLARIRQRLHDLRNDMLTVAFRFSATKRAHQRALTEHAAALAVLRATVLASQAKRVSHG